MIRILGVITLLSASTFAFAYKDRMDDFLTLELGLDETRAAQVAEIFEEAREEAYAIKKEHRAKMDSHREAIKAQLSTILTDEEMAKLEETKRKKMKGHPHREHRFEKGE
jgi:hypothetical protein